jgi:hypothetical protein
MLPTLLVLALCQPAWTQADEVEASSELSIRGVPLTITREIELQAGLRQAAVEGLSLPLGGALLLDAADSRRNMGAMADLSLGMEPIGPQASAALRGLELYRRNPEDKVELRVGRLSLVRGGRFRFVDGADAAAHLGHDLTLAAWGGTAWHPERTGLTSGGATWGLDLAHRSAHPLGGALRYEHVAAEEGGGVERFGADASLHLPASAGLRLVARADLVAAEAPVELLSLSAELRPQHRLHLRFHTGSSNPTTDSLGRGGAIASLFQEGPHSFADATARLSLEHSVLSADVGGLLRQGEETLEPGWRASLSRSSHAGVPIKHVVRLSGLGGPGGTATALLGELGRELGPLDLSVLGEQALFRFAEQDWRGMTVLGARTATTAGASWRLALLAQLSLGQHPVPETELYLVATQQLSHGRARKPAHTRDRFLSPYSPPRWTQEDLARSPGTVPGADPYPSIPIPPEADDAP